MSQDKSKGIWIKMDINLDLDEKKVKKALGASEKQMERLHRRAANRTAVNARAIASKGDLGLDGLRRKKVPRARVKPLTGRVPGIWFGLNEIRASEFKEKPVEEGKGVRFQGEHHRGYFLARFKYDPNPKSIKRAVRLPKGKRSWKELMVSIEEPARAFIREKIEPKIGELFNKNFEQVVDHLANLKWK